MQGSNDIYTSTPGASFFIALFITDKAVDVVPAVDAMPPIWSFKFLSHRRGAAAGHLAGHLPAAVAYLKDYGLMWQVQEALVNQALLGRLHTGSRYMMKNWQYYEDPGASTLQSNYRLDAAPAGVCQLSGGLGEFNGRYPSTNVKHLKPGTLYQSKGGQTVLVEGFSVDHKLKKVTGYQTSQVMPQSKGYMIYQLEKFLSELKVLEEGYTLDLLYIMDEWTSRLARNPSRAGPSRTSMAPT